VPPPTPPAPEPGEADDGLLDFLELAAHELFHAWNGKRLRPATLGPFDYHRENYTRELWLVEGLTSYYDRLSVLRSGQMPVADLPEAPR
jgi:predicted metalloprotease with PDZ domain